MAENEIISFFPFDNISIKPKLQEWNCLMNNYVHLVFL